MAEIKRVVIDCGGDPYYADPETGERVEPGVKGAVLVTPKVTVREAAYTPEERTRRDKDVAAANQAQADAQAARTAKEQEVEALVNKQQPTPADAMRVMRLDRELRQPR